jgi:hypothetical protein
VFVSNAIEVEPLEGRCLLSSVVQLVRDIEPGKAGSNPAGVSTVNGVTYFQGYQRRTGGELCGPTAPGGAPIS